MRKRLIFDSLETFIRERDHTSLSHLIKWEYAKLELFQMENKEGMPLIHIACINKDFKSLDVLLKNGASVHAKSASGWTALHAAAAGGDVDIVSFLLRECSADPLQTDDKHRQPSQLSDDQEIVTLLENYALRHQTKKNLENMATELADLPKRRTLSCLTTTESEKPRVATRTRSMFLKGEEVSQIRLMYSKRKDLKLTTGDVESEKVLESKQSQLLSVPSQEFTVLYRQSYRNKPPTPSDDKVMGKIHSGSHLLKSQPSAHKFSSKKSCEAKNRDSGIYDDESDERKNSDANHYKLI